MPMASSSNPSSQPSTSSVALPTAVPWWQWPTLLSLDAPLVALVWQQLFARSFNLQLHSYQAVLLGASVWLIYVADRWLDAWQLNLACLHTQRHRLYQRWRYPLAGLWLLLLLATAALAGRYASAMEWRLAGLLLLVTGGYFSALHLPRYMRLAERTLGSKTLWGKALRSRKLGTPLLPKEVQVGAVFAAGVTLVLWPQLPWWPQLMLPTLLFAGLCSLNCSLIALWEAEVDRQQGQLSIMQSHPQVAGYLEPSCLVLAGLAWWLAPFPLGLALALAALNLYGLQRCASHMSRSALRVLADALLLTPLLFY